jgi:hypothetical protein
MIARVVPTTVAAEAVAVVAAVRVVAVAVRAAVVVVVDIAPADKCGAMMARRCRRRTAVLQEGVDPSNSVRPVQRRAAGINPVAEKRRHKRHYIELESVRYVTAESN